MSSADATLPDHVRIHPAALTGSVDVTGDKSIGHRCLLVGSLSDQEVRLQGLPPSGDVRATARALVGLGVRVDLEPGPDGRLEGSVAGPLPHRADESPIAIDCGNSGTTLRLLAGVAAGARRHVILDGDSSLRRRPVDRVRAPLAAMGVTTRAREDRLPPLEVLPGQVEDVHWVSPVASAQIKSAILLAAVAAGTRASVVSPHPSRDHTERMLRHAGVEVRTITDEADREVVTLEGGSPRVAVLAAPRDPSAAAFWHVAAACGAGSITTPAVCLNAGRTGALEVIRAMGSTVDLVNEREAFGEPVGDVIVRGSGLSGAEIAGALVVRCIDELPVLALAGALSEDGLEVRDAEELRVKESDRISVLGSSLEALGLVLEEHPDGFRIPGGQRPGPGTVDADGDHRIAMTAAIAACLGTGPVEIHGFRAVATSYPSFLADLVALGGRVEVIDA